MYINFLTFAPTSCVGALHFFSRAPFPEVPFALDLADLRCSEKKKKKKLFPTGNSSSRIPRNARSRMIKHRAVVDRLLRFDGFREVFSSREHRGVYARVDWRPTCYYDSVAWGPTAGCVIGSVGMQHSIGVAVHRERGSAKREPALQCAF